ncbi:hypothetical protein C8Q75DRAFT_795724 [Abortiporus biennis]|nr:hypothetical protein C8Q75DRAFT_795724 [Abortiporus biennis]
MNPPKPPTRIVNMSKSSSVPRSESKAKQPSASDYEDWLNLKELFSRASELCECDEQLEALPLLRAVIRECHRLLNLYPDPSVIYADPHSLKPSRTPEMTTPIDERTPREWSESFESKTNALRAKRFHSRRDELPTAFHTIFGIALFLIGNIIAQDSSLALPDEPSSANTFWLAALDVFETGESLPSVIDGRTGVGASEDWRMAIVWGRTLVCLAEEQLEHARAHEAKGRLPTAEPQSLADAWASIKVSSGAIPLPEPSYPKDSPFHTIAMHRPPVTRRMSLYSASAHEIMVLATDQFSRGIFHMPHPAYPTTHNPTTHISSHSSTTQLPIPRRDSVATQTEISPVSETRTPYLLSPDSSITAVSSPVASTSGSSYFGLPTSGAASASPGTPANFSRPKELYTIASEVLSVAESLPDPNSREYWATWADSVFNQMKMEADMNVWRGSVIKARGRCWLVVGSARSEELEDALERGEENVLLSEEAEVAREGLATAISFFERAKGSATLQDDDEDISPLLAEALITLANLTPDNNKREELYIRAQLEGGDQIMLDVDGSQSSNAFVHSHTASLMDEDEVMDES